jgi:hypothetical protein
MADNEHAALVEKANVIIDSSRLTGADKILLKGRIQFVTGAMLQTFVAVCEEDPFSVEAVVKSMKKKLEAQGNLVKLHEIIKQEKTEIEDLLDAHATAGA